MSVHVGTGAAHTARLDGCKSKQASPAIEELTVGSARETNPFMVRRRALLPSSKRWNFVPVDGEDLFVEQSAAVSKQDWPAPCSRHVPEDHTFAAPVAEQPMLPPASRSPNNSSWAKKCAIDGLDEADSEANIWHRAVSTDASTACPDDFEERSQSKDFPGIPSEARKECI